jgi:hypothetical protein
LGSSPTPPAVTAPTTTATAQQALNTTSGTQSQQGSMVNQATPYGSLTYNQIGTSSTGTPLYSASTSLSPAEQSLFNTYTGTQQTAGTAGQQLLQNANYGATNPATAVGNATSGLTGQAVQQEENYLQPFFTPQTQQLQTQLLNQGIMPNSPAYTQAMNNLQQSQGQTESGFVANIEPQMYQQALSTYELPATLGGQLTSEGSSTNPTFQQTPGLTVQPANLVGATANAQQANQQSYQDQVTQYNNMMSGLMGIPTAILGGWAKAGGASAAAAALPAALAAL